MANIRETIKSNPKIRGWSNYFRYSCAKKTFSYVDYQIYKT
ncbi:group II intron maturase-specific domain-containing protein [Legionella pneumophila]